MRITNYIYFLLIVFTNFCFAQKSKSRSKLYTKPLDKTILRSTDKTELEQRKKRLQQEIIQYNKELEETKKDKRTSMKNLIILNQKIMKRQALIYTINEELEVTAKQISENIDNINQLNNKLKLLRSNYANMVLNLYKNRNQSTTINFIANSENFNQSIRRIEYLKRIAIARKEQIGAINHTTTELNTTVQKLEIIKEDKSRLLDSKEKEKEIFDEEKNQKEKVVAQLQTREKELKSQIRKKQEDANKLSNAIKNIIEQEIRKAREAAIAEAKRRKKEIEKSNSDKKDKIKKDNPASETVANKEDEKKIENINKEIEEAESAKSSEEVFALSSENQKLSNGFENNKNRLPWPVISGSVISGFGEHEHPVLKGIKIKNNGLDIKTKSNESGRSVFDGVVTGVISIPGAGKAVIIRHGEYLSVYSNLATTFVNKGDKVKAKQPIGIVDNGESGSGELHFEIWKGQITQNPQTWLSRN